MQYFAPYCHLPLFVEDITTSIYFQNILMSEWFVAWLGWHWTQSIRKKRIWMPNQFDSFWLYNIIGKICIIFIQVKPRVVPYLSQINIDLKTLHSCLKFAHTYYNQCPFYWPLFFRWLPSSHKQSCWHWLEWALNTNAIVNFSIHKKKQKISPTTIFSWWKIIPVVLAWVVHHLDKIGQKSVDNKSQNHQFYFSKPIVLLTDRQGHFEMLLNDTIKHAIEAKNFSSYLLNQWQKMKLHCKKFFPDLYI